MSDSGIDPKAEAQRIVRRYFTGLALAKQNKNWIVERVIPSRDWGSQSRDMTPDLRRAEEIELEVDEKFGEEVDRWRNNDSPLAKAVLVEMIKLLDKRPGISYFGKKMLTRIKDEVYKE